MQKIKVYLQYPWRFPDSSYYKYLIENPPKDIEFLNGNKNNGVITKTSRFKMFHAFKTFIKNFPQKFGIAIANARIAPAGNYDLIHGCHCLIKNTNVPWVMDVEMTGSFLISGFNLRSRIDKVRKYLIRDNCKKILPWTNELKERILADYPEIKNKIEVVYPAVPIKKIKKIKKNIPTIIFIGRSFEFKGGFLALEILKNIKKKRKIRAIIISSVPENMKKLYPEIEIHDLMSQDKMFNLLANSDVFLYPSQLDTFGFSVIEAMSFGVPTVALSTKNNSSIKEIVENGKTGFLIDYDNNQRPVSYIGDKEKLVIQNFLNKIDMLLEDRKLYAKMSKNCLKETTTGRFSIKRRNKKLKEIYKEALK